jgi:hypothetical protein
MEKTTTVCRNVTGICDEERCYCVEPSMDETMHPQNVKVQNEEELADERIGEE